MKDKLIYFVMGEQGSGKTTLSNQLASKTKGKSEVFDDYQYLSIDKKYKTKMLNEVASVRHTGKTIYICSKSPRFLHSNWNVTMNKYVTWILTSLSWEEYESMVRQGFSNKHLKKLFVGWRNYLKQRRKTRPYLLLTLNKNESGLLYEHHRYTNEKPFRHGVEQ